MTRVFTCDECGATYVTPLAAEDCCGDWIELDDGRGYD